MFGPFFYKNNGLVWFEVVVFGGGGGGIFKISYKMVNVRVVEPYYMLSFLILYFEKHLHILVFLLAMF